MAEKEEKSIEKVKEICRNNSGFAGSFIYNNDADAGG